MDKEVDFTRDYSSDGGGGNGSLANARWADPVYVAEKYAYKEGAIWLGRNPHNPDEAIGYKDDRHVFINAENRSGKGRALLVNNQVLWPGSLITVGPKGEEASIAAIRRGSGNEHCQGLGQAVYVLDPMRCADVPDSYRAHFNLLAALDPEDGELVSKVDRIANAICTIPDAAEAAEWSKAGKSYVANVILHVVTSEHIAEEDRNILTVRDLVIEGNVKGAAILEEHFAAQNEQRTVRPHEILLKEMVKNTACHGAISRNAQDMFQSYETHVKYFESVRKAASDHLRFLEGQGISKTVTKPDDEDPQGYHRTFSIDDIKTDKISIFLCLPEDCYDPLDRWLRAMIEVLLGGMQQKQGLPANGHQVLFTIDEFANLGKMDSIGKAINSIAGAGVKLMIAVQRLGDLQELYGKTWEKFIAGAGTQIWFGAEEIATREYLEKKLGKTEISKVGRTVGKNSSQSVADGVTEGYSHTNSLSDSETYGETASTTKGYSRSKARSRSRSKGKNSSYGSNDGKSAGRNYGPHLFFEGFERGTNYGSNSGRQRGGGRNNQTSYTQGTTDSKSYSENHGTSQSTSHQQGSSDTHQKGTSHTDTSSTGQSAGLNETFHVKPLLSSLEAKQFLLSLPELDHPAYPGFALITLAEEEHPFLVRKANHDQDPFFIRKFNPNPAHKFIPFHECPLLGWQITPEHFYTITIPEGLKDREFTITELRVRKNERIELNTPLFKYAYNGNSSTNLLKLPFPVKIIEILPPETIQETGGLLIVRAAFALDEEERDKLQALIWADALRLLEHERRAQEEETERKRRLAEAEARQKAKAEAEAAKLRAEAEKIAKARQLKQLKIAAAITGVVVVISIFIEFIQWLMAPPPPTFLYIQNRAGINKVVFKRSDHQSTLLNFAIPYHDGYEIHIDGAWFYLMGEIENINFELIFSPNTVSKNGGYYIDEKEYGPLDRNKYYMVIGPMNDIGTSGYRITTYHFLNKEETARDLLHSGKESPFSESYTVEEYSAAYLTIKEFYPTPPKNNNELIKLLKKIDKQTRFSKNIENINTSWPMNDEEYSLMMSKINEISKEIVKCEMTDADYTINKTHYAHDCYLENGDSLKERLKLLSPTNIRIIDFREPS